MTLVEQSRGVILAINPEVQELCRQVLNTGPTPPQP